MKKITAIIAIVLTSILLASCGTSDGPLTEAQQAEKYNMSVGEFKEQKDAAARMNMTIEDHLKMSDTSGDMDMSWMDMSDDSAMIEDDSEEKMVMPEWAHRMPDGTIMNADGSIVGDSDMSGTHKMEDWETMDNRETMSWDSTHTMDDGTVMTDKDMHMETMHEDDDIEDHGSDTHWDHE